MTYFIILAIILWIIYGRVSRADATRGVSPLSEQDIDIRMLALAQAVITADGQVKREETAYVRENFISAFGSVRAQRAFAAFNSFEYKRDVRRICAEMSMTLSYQSRLSVLLFLFQVGAADNDYNDAEHRVIFSISQMLGISQQHFQYVFNSFTSSGRNYTSAQQKMQSKSPYEILGVEEGASMEQVKRSYKTLVKKYHPDRLVKYSQAERDAAQEKFIEVQKAYETIKATW